MHPTAMKIILFTSLSKNEPENFSVLSLIVPL